MGRHAQVCPHHFPALLPLSIQLPPSHSHHQVIPFRLPLSLTHFTLHFTPAHTVLCPTFIFALHTLWPLSPSKANHRCAGNVNSVDASAQHALVSPRMTEVRSRGTGSVFFPMLLVRFALRWTRPPELTLSSVPLERSPIR